MSTLPTTTKMYRVPEGDLAILERSLSVIHEAVVSSPAYKRADVQVSLEEAKRILSDMRWDYGPYQEVHVIPVEKDCDE